MRYRVKSMTSRSRPVKWRRCRGIKAIFDQIKSILTWSMTRRNREVVNFKRYRVKNYSKLTNFRKFTRIEGYNGKYGSNPQGIKQFLDVFFKFDQIGREIDGRNWGKWYFMKVDSKRIHRIKNHRKWSWFRGEIANWSGEKFSDVKIAILS